MKFRAGIALVNIIISNQNWTFQHSNCLVSFYCDCVGVIIDIFMTDVVLVHSELMSQLKLVQNDFVSLVDCTLQWKQNRCKDLCHIVHTLYLCLDVYACICVCFLQARMYMIIIHKLTRARMQLRWDIFCLFIIKIYSLKSYQIWNLGRF